MNKFICLLLLLTATAAQSATTSFKVDTFGQGDQHMILIPGLGCSGKVWQGTVDHYAKTYSIHVLTLAGFGGEDALEGPFLERVRSDLAAYIRDNHIEKPILIGHSLGAFMSFWLAATEPDLPGAVIAVDGVPYLSALGNPDATVETSRAFAEGMRDKMIAVSSESFLANTRRALTMMITDPAQVEQVFVDSSRTHPKAAAWAIYEMMTHDLRPLVSSIKVPLLLIGAYKDMPEEMKPTMVEAYKAQIASIAGATFVEANSARHFVMLDDPRFFQQTVSSFLGEHIQHNIEEVQ